MENWEDSHCIFRLQLVVCNIGSDYDDSLYVVIPEKYTICYMDHKKEIAKQKLGFTMLNACCVSTDLSMYGCMEKLVTKDGFCIDLKNVLKIASISVGGHIYLTVNTSIFIIVLRAHCSVKDIWGVRKAEYIKLPLRD